ncbi:MAG: 16S rRNA (adenine(1518)-N(6)/adenine(1519)-N(6))-dimethyltransferase RsmA [Gemmataceae bacterium]|nr:16S rRNA (adenine(1518)-N(6)/adenine(1519)-N(6))-dimethyltransferase RsmA [Gemmataceae bacterium]MDW8266182.1 16S rRNA (adenine(1518)-N(6)/adenine(1519)-N(6))-dimethyltransferase RsmA [Gemmataceae bacterium]
MDSKPRSAQLNHPSPRQTLSYLRNLFDERGIRPKNKLGQNFLIDLNLIDLLVRSAELDRSDFVLEIGCGTGSLTTRLAEQAGLVLGVEVDAAFFALAQEMVQGRDNVVLLHADVLRNKNELNPTVLAKVDELWRQGRCARMKLVSNLPYAVATPVIANFLLTDLPLERMTVTVQWEIAERLMAAPGTKDYGALAVLVQSLADVRLIRKLPPSVFWPKPEVASAMVFIRPVPAKRERVGQPKRLRHFLRALYAHRRKNLRGVLASLYASRLSKEEVDRQLAELGIDGSVRAEDLTIEQHLRLCQAFAPPEEESASSPDTSDSSTFE